MRASTSTADNRLNHVPPSLEGGEQPWTPCPGCQQAARTLEPLADRAAGPAARSRVPHQLTQHWPRAQSPALHHGGRRPPGSRHLLRPQPPPLDHASATWGSIELGIMPTTNRFIGESIDWRLGTPAGVPAWSALARAWLLHWPGEAMRYSTSPSVHVGRLLECNRQSPKHDLPLRVTAGSGPAAAARSPWHWLAQAMRGHSCCPRLHRCQQRQEPPEHGPANRCDSGTDYSGTKILVYRVCQCTADQLLALLGKSNVST